jgi:hypothetical protein
MNFVVIRTFQNYFNAHITMTRLRSEGIDCYLRDEFTVTVDPVLSNAVGGIKLIVNNNQLEEANKLLQQFDEEYRQSAVCPRCGNRTIELVPKQTTANLATAVLTWLLGSYAISPKNIYQCSSCNYESETLPEVFISGMEADEIVPNQN